MKAKKRKKIIKNKCHDVRRCHRCRFNYQRETEKKKKRKRFKVDWRYSVKERINVDEANSR